MENLVKQIFTKKEKEDGSIYYYLNDDLQINIEDDQEASKFLADVIRYWHDERRLFCHDNTSDWIQNESGESVKKYFPEDDWTFSYKTPSSCGSCVNAQKLLDKIFGSKSRFNRLSYVEYTGHRNYKMRFDLLLAFIQDGKEKVEAIKNEEARKAAEQDQREAKEARERRLDKVLELTSKEVPLAAHDFLVDIASRDRTHILDLKVSNDVVVVLTLRKHWSGVSAIAHYSQVYVFAEGASEMKEWQYRDQSANEDYRYKIESFGSIMINREDGKIVVNAELVTGYLYPDLDHTFKLEISAKGESEHPKLSEEDLAKLRKNVESERAKMRKHLDEMRERKPQMLASIPGTPNGYQNYSDPKVGKATVLDTGVAYFITEEQIDHRTKYRQMRHELYVMKPSDSEARRVIEDHAYENQRNVFVRVINISPDEVTVETSEGTVPVSLKPVEA